MDEIRHVIVGGVRTACLSRDALCRLMLEDARNKRLRAPAKLIFDVNGHALALARWDKAFRDDLAAADLLHADGQIIVAASKYLTTSPIPERSATTDLFHDAAAAAVLGGVSFYLLGGTEDVNARCTQRMLELYPDLHIAGRRNGYFSESEEEAICDAINASGADVVWVGLGKPKEQAFCIRNRYRLKASWLVTCGGCYNYVIGEYSRAPEWMQDIGMEWAHRLVTRPKQFLWRYLTTNPVALYLLLTQTRNDTLRG